MVGSGGGPADGKEVVRAYLKNVRSTLPRKDRQLFDKVVGKISEQTNKDQAPK